MAAVVAALAFSTEGLFSVRSFQLGVDVSTALATRYAIATLAVFGWLWRSYRRDREPGVPAPVDLFYLVIAGLLAHAGLPRLLFESFLLIPTWLTLLVFYTYPVMVAMGEHLLGRERVTGRRMLLILTALIGVALVAQSQGEMTIDPLGVIYALGAAALNTIFMLLLGPVLQRVQLSTAVAVQFTGGLLAHGVVLIAGGAAGARLVGAMAAWPWLIALGIISTVISVVALNWSVRTIGAGLVAVITTLEPVFVIVWGVALLDEPITVKQIFGALLITLSVLGVVVFGAKRPPFGKESK